MRPGSAASLPIPFSGLPGTVISGSHRDARADFVLTNPCGLPPTNDDEAMKFSTDADAVFFIQRTVVAAISLLCLVAAAFLLVYDPDWQKNVMMAVCLRVGTLLGVIWLAMPQLRTVSDRVPALLMGGGLLLMVLLATRPKVFTVLGSVVVVITALAAISGWLRRLKN